MNEYLTFEEAIAFLNTTRSTLYRWLREEKVPAHKLGRQWRFLRTELQVYRGSGERSKVEQEGLADLARLLHTRMPKEAEMKTEGNTTSAVAENLIWNAVDWYFPNNRTSC